LAVNPPTTLPTTSTFDANGNLILDNTNNRLSTYTWDPENRLTSFAINAPFEHDSYDAAGMRLSTVDTTRTIMTYTLAKDSQFRVKT
jgi:YD repeat-containing protein